jgi:hypothetical protein
MGVVENMRLDNLRLPIVNAFSGDVRLVVRLGDCVRCLYVARASGPLSLSPNVESSCHVDPQCTS